MIFLSLLAKELLKVKAEALETSVLVPALLSASSATLVKCFYTLHPLYPICTSREVRRRTDKGLRVVLMVV